MTDSYEIQFEGRLYTWSLWLEERSENAWTWANERNENPPTAQLHRLNDLLISTHGTDIVAQCPETDRDRLYQILRSMRVADQTLYELGFESEISTSNPACAVACRFAVLPDQGHLPFNSSVLRDWFFDQSASHAPKAVHCIGSGPFEIEEFSASLLQRNVIDIGGLLSGETLEERHPPVILGREGWGPDELDALIDGQEGYALRIYSQEMYLAQMACGRDPFVSGPEVLAAFQAAHPGLEFVSQGWTGWVTTYVSHARQSRPFDPTRFGDQQVGPLSEMGYHVGVNGESEDVRRTILSRAFTGSLPIVGLESYMSEWGNPNSGERLRKIADSLASFCQLNKRKQGRSTQAVEDWESDLSWLCAEYYAPHGRYRFAWPSI